MSALWRGTVTLVAALGLAAGANAATVTLNIDPAESSGSTLPKPGGGVAYQAPFTLLRFVATVTNDVGAVPLPVSGQYATVDLVARTVDGEKVVNTQTVFDATPLKFILQPVTQNTVYYARVNPALANGVAAAAVSAETTIPAYLKNYPNASRNSITRKVTFSGFFSNPEGVVVRNSVRVLIQRKKGSLWKTVATAVPDAARSWKAKVPIGPTPVAWRVRTVPINGIRYQKVTELRYCVARTRALAAKACKGIALGIN